MAKKRKDLARKPVGIDADSNVLDVAIRKATNEALASIGTEEFTCHLCGRLYKRDGFYKSTDDLSQTHIAPVCKNCCSKIAYRVGLNGTMNTPTPTSIQQVLRYLDKPWINSLYKSSLKEVNDAKKNDNLTHLKGDVWKVYIKNIQMPQYDGLRWKDGDLGDQCMIQEATTEHAKEAKDMMKINRATVINALGYDPFSTANDNDKPLMYSKLVGFLDESTNDDEFKLGACVEITHSLNQTERLNQVINDLQRTTTSIKKNVSTIKTLEDTKNKIFRSALALAKDNGISIKHSNHNSKGSNQWTGKVKELKEMNLRSEEVNAFEIETAKGMQQVAQASVQAIYNSLDLDENKYTEIIKTQRKMIESLKGQLSASEEEGRIFRRENTDLKDFMRDKGLIDNLDRLVIPE